MNAPSPSEKTGRVDNTPKAFIHRAALHKTTNGGAKATVAWWINAFGFCPPYAQIA
jgi:hypothetical protein